MIEAQNPSNLNREEEYRGNDDAHKYAGDDQESSFIEDDDDHEKQENSEGDMDNTSYDYDIGEEVEEEEEDDCVDCDEKEGRVHVAVHRHLNFDEENEDEDENDEEDGEHRQFEHHERDVENPPVQEEEMSRKFDRAPSMSAKRVTSSASSLGGAASLSPTSHRKRKEQDGRSGENRVTTAVNSVLVPIFAWLQEVWRDLTPANASKCASETKTTLHILFLAKGTWSACLPYLMAGLALSFCCEVVHQGPQYNTALLLALMAGFEFSFFPSNSVRPQLMLSLLVLTSVLLDIVLFAQPPQVVNDGAKVLTAMVLLAKALALYKFLCQSSAGSRAKKYLWRRLRVFLVPLSYPRKPMREIRSRVLAIEWLQGGVAVGYVVLFIFGFMTVGAADVMSSPPAGMPLVAFLPLKFLTSSAIFMMLVIDTDVTLCLAYFGCLGGMMSYVKAYIHSKQQEYGGWPLSYALNPYRVYAVAFLKFVDVCLGFAGWAAIGTTFSTYNSLGNNAMALVAGTVTVLVLSDIWAPILFACVVRLIRQHDARVGRLQATEEDSDDSELDEFDIRENETAIKNGRLMRYRYLNQEGFIKPFKNKQSVGSSSSDGESDSRYGSSNSHSDDSDEEEGRSRKKKTTKTDDEHGDDDRLSMSSRGAGLNINLEMALGGSCDDDEDDEDDEDDNDHEDGGGHEDEDDDDDDEAEQEDCDEANRLTSPGGVSPPQHRPPPAARGGLTSPNAIPAAHGWGGLRHNKVAAAFSPGQGAWGQATSDASYMQSQSQSQSQIQVRPRESPLPNPHRPPSQRPMVLPPLDTSSRGEDKGRRPPSLPRLPLQPAFSPGPKNKIIDYDDDLDSDVEFTFDSPYQPKIRTKTGTPIQQHALRPLQPVVGGSHTGRHPPTPLSPQPASGSGSGSGRSGGASPITIEVGASISPERYTDMWDDLDVSASFAAQLHPEKQADADKLVQLVAHLQAEKFYVVAAGEADHMLTIYGFASGFKKEEAEQGVDDSMHLGVAAVNFLMELRINTDPAQPHGMWSFECNCKCTSPAANSVFIKMMLLGDCLRLVKS